MDTDTDYTIREFDDRDTTAVIDIFNHYIVNSFVAYADEPVGYEAIAIFKDMIKEYSIFVVETDDGDRRTGFFLSAALPPDGYLQACGRNHVFHSS